MKIKGTSSSKMPKLQTIKGPATSIPITHQAAAKNQRAVENQILYTDTATIRKMIDASVENEIHNGMDTNTAIASMKMFSLFDALYPYFLTYQRHLTIKIAEMQQGDAFFEKYDPNWPQRPDPVRNKFRKILKLSISAVEKEMAEFEKMIENHQKKLAAIPDMEDEVVKIQEQLNA